MEEIYGFITKICMLLVNPFRPQGFEVKGDEKTTQTVGSANGWLYPLIDTAASSVVLRGETIR